MPFDQAIGWRGQSTRVVGVSQAKNFSGLGIDMSDEPAVAELREQIYCEIIELSGAAIEVTTTLSCQKAGGIEPDALLDLYKDEQITHMLPLLSLDEQRRFRKGA